MNDGLALWCKACVSDYDRTRYLNNPAPARARARVWGKDNPKRRAVISRRWAAGNREQAADAVKRWNEKNPERSRKIKRDAQQRRRALQAGAYREEYTSAEILERDSWLCQMPECRCPDGRTIDPKAPYPWRATIDHVVPISEGGDDAPHNLRAAHQTCNSACYATRKLR
jgi:5-methylcytosine-specific restriction endonuclease McrA